MLFLGRRAPRVEVRMSILRASVIVSVRRMRRQQPLQLPRKRKESRPSQKKTLMMAAEIWLR